MGAAFSRDFFRYEQVCPASPLHRVGSSPREPLGDRMTELNQKVLKLAAADFLYNYRPRETLFYLDAPIRQSGELAAEIRSELKSWKLPGDAQAMKVPEKCLVGAQGIVASSDSAVLDGVKQAFDLAAAVIKSLPQRSDFIDFTSLG